MVSPGMKKSSLSGEWPKPQDTALFQHLLDLLNSGKLVPITFSGSWALVLARLAVLGGHQWVLLISPETPWHPLNGNLKTVKSHCSWLCIYTRSPKMQLSEGWTNPQTILGGGNSGKAKIYKLPRLKKEQLTNVSCLFTCFKKGRWNGGVQVLFLFLR